MQISLPPDRSELVPRNAKVCFHSKTLSRRNIKGEACIYQKTLPFLFGKMANLCLQLRPCVPSTDKIPHMVDCAVPAWDRLAASLGGWCGGLWDSDQGEMLCNTLGLSYSIHDIPFQNWEGALLLCFHRGSQKVTSWWSHLLPYSLSLPVKVRGGVYSLHIHCPGALSVLLLASYDCIYCK